jgi:hypothetical protein
MVFNYSPRTHEAAGVNTFSLWGVIAFRQALLAPK